MLQEDKELLLKDLCARLPYGVKVNNETHGDFNIFGIVENFVFVRNEVYTDGFDIEKIKPYLFPMSNMTEVQEIEYDATFATIRYEDGINDSAMTYKSFDWLNKNHFDYRGLIPMGLAIDASNLNIY